MNTNARGDQPEPAALAYDWPVEDLTEDEWRQVIAHCLRCELADPREDIYSEEASET